MIRPVPLALMRAVTERAKNVGLPPSSLLTRRAKGAAIRAYALDGASYMQAICAAHAVIRGVPMPMPENVA